MRRLAQPEGRAQSLLGRAPSAMTFELAGLVEERACSLGVRIGRACGGRRSEQSEADEDAGCDRR